MSVIRLYPRKHFDLAHLGSAGCIEDWELRREPGTDGYVLRGVDERGHERETGPVQGLDLDEGWAWATGTGLVRLGAARAYTPTTGVTL